MGLPIPYFQFPISNFQLQEDAANTEDPAQRRQPL
jgi:hypothetical protein